MQEINEELNQMNEKEIQQWESLRVEKKIVNYWDSEYDSQSGDTLHPEDI